MTVSTDGELSRFREEWIKEVQTRKPQTSSSPAGVPVEQSLTHPSASVLSAQAAPAPAPVGVLVDRDHFQAGRGTIPVAPPVLLSALQIYRQAVDAETRGSLDEALRLYRRAFRLDANVDRAYDRVANQPSFAGYHFTATHVSTQRSEEKPPRSRETTIKAMASIVSSFPSGPVTFSPEDETSGVPIDLLPVELIIRILRILGRICDYSSIESFASVSRKARLISLESTIWRDITNRLYVFPQIPRDQSFPEIVHSKYDNDYRQATIEHPRLRFDGVYIAVCHCIRPGQSENPWANVSHLITYHRYLRFFREGTVLSLLANDDNPSDVVRSLKPSYRRPGFFIGSWSLSGSTVLVRDLMDPSGLVVKYGFTMDLNLKSKPLGRWNKLEMIQYSTIRLETGETDFLPLRHERPFWFSRVRMYDREL